MPEFYQSELLKTLDYLDHGFHTKNTSLDENTLISINQIHSDIIISDNFKTAQGDGLITDKTGQKIAVKTADCVPLLMAAKNTPLVAAVHAGWKGALFGVIDNAVKEFEARGIKPTEIIVAIGPSIQDGSYEVGSERYEEFIKEDARNDAFFTPSGREGHYLFELPRYCENKLKNLGVMAIDNLGLDTYSHVTEFNSYRRTTHENEHLGQSLKAGRNWSVIEIIK